MWTTGSVILECLLVITRQTRYWIMAFFLFCPQQLSACSLTQTMVVKEVDPAVLAPLLQSPALSVKKFACREIASHLTPKTVHVLGVNK